MKTFLNARTFLARGTAFDSSYAFAVPSLSGVYHQNRAFRHNAPRLATDGGGIFTRYTEIDNSNEKRIRALRQLNMCGKSDEWIGTEKVHGANFGVYSTDFGTKIRYAKRSGFIADSEHFFGYQVLIPELVTCVRRIRELLEAKFGKSFHTVIVNGELFGGKYQHPNVPKSKQVFNMRGKMKGINAVQNDSFPQYSPNLHFYAFDIKYRVKPPPLQAAQEDDKRGDSATTVDEIVSSDPDENVQTVLYDEAIPLFEQVPGLLFARAIVRGTMDEVAAFDVENFQTTVPALVGLSNFPLKGNWAEGLVVKHAKRGLIGWEPKGPTILKFKSTAFQEISTDRSQGPRVDAMADVRRESIARAGVQLPRLSTVLQQEDELKAAEYLLRHVTQNRLRNLLSKLGPDPFINESITPNSLADSLAQDALKDFLKEAERAIINCSSYTRMEMARYCLFACRKLVCDQWKDIVKEMKEQQAAYEAADAVDTAENEL